MSTIAELIAKLTLDNGDFIKGLEKSKEEIVDIGMKFGQDMTNAGKSMQKTGAIITAALLPISLLYNSAANEASDFSEQHGKVNQVFGESAAAIHAWAETTASAFGISKLEATEYAGTFGNILTTQGLAKESAAEMSKALVQLAADQAAFNNLKTEDVLDKFKSGLIGVYRPLLDLGIVISETEVRAKAMEMGLADANGKLDESALVQARLALITEQSANAIGQFARESDGLAGKQKILNSELSNLKITIGNALLPTLISLTETLTKLVSGFSKLSPSVQKGVIAFGGLLAILGPVITIIGTMMTAIGGITTFFAGPAAAAIGGFITTTLAPMLPVIAAIIGAVVLLKTAWENNWGGMQEKVSEITESIKSIVQSFLTALQDFWTMHGETITAVVTSIWNFITGIFSWAVNAALTIVQAFLLALQGDFQGAGALILGLVQSTWNSILAAINGVIQKILTAFRNVNWAQIGRMIIDGIINGLNAMVGKLIQVVKNISARVQQAWNVAFGIQSPSKVFYDYGVYMMRGLQVGLEKSAKLPIAVLDKLQNEIKAGDITRTDLTNVTADIPKPQSANKELIALFEGMISAEKPATAREIARAVRDAFAAVGG